MSSPIDGGRGILARAALRAVAGRFIIPELPSRAADNTLAAVRGAVAVAGVGRRAVVNGAPRVRIDTTARLRDALAPVALAVLVGLRIAVVREDFLGARGPGRLVQVDGAVTHQSGTDLRHVAILVLRRTTLHSRRGERAVRAAGVRVRALAPRFQQASAAAARVVEEEARVALLAGVDDAVAAHGRVPGRLDVLVQALGPEVATTIFAREVAVDLEAPLVAELHARAVRVAGSHHRLHDVRPALVVAHAEEVAQLVRHDRRRDRDAARVLDDRARPGVHAEAVHPREARRRGGEVLATEKDARVDGHAQGAFEGRPLPGDADGERVEEARRRDLVARARAVAARGAIGRTPRAVHAVAAAPACRCRRCCRTRTRRSRGCAPRQVTCPIRTGTTRQFSLSPSYNRRARPRCGCRASRRRARPCAPRRRRRAERSASRR